MYAKKVTYVDLFSDEQVAETLYFNLTDSDVIDIEAKYNGNANAAIKRIMDSKDPEAIIGMFKYIIGKAYGERPVNTNKFIKSKEITDAFLASPAFSELLFEMLENPESSKDFFQHVFPDMNKLKLRLDNIMKSRKETIEQSDEVVSVV